MQSHSLTGLLKSFSPKEINAFRDFLISPYFNKKNSVIKLFEILRKHYPDFTGEEISKENIYSQLFPGKTYNDNNFRVLVHNLNELAKKFITYRNFENNKPEFDYRLVLELINKQQFNHLGKLIDKLLSDLNKKDFIAEEYNFHKFRLEYDKIYYLSVSHIGQFEKFLDNADFEKLFRYLSTYYYLKSMRLYINVLNLQIIYKKEFSTVAFEKMLPAIDKETIENDPVIELFYCIIKLFDRSDEEKFYFRAKDILKLLGNTLYFDDIREIYINLTNYCNRKILTGNTGFQKEKFALYQEEISLKLYELNGCMSPVYYKSLVILGLNLKEYNWIKNFIFDYKDELHSDSKEYVFNYCLALYEFDMENYEESLKLLSKIKYNELYLKYDSKVLQMMIYYEMKSEESLISSMEAFRHFLSNNKMLPEDRKKLYSNFYMSLNKILNFHKKMDLFDLENFKSKLNNNLPVSNKHWILNKLNSLA